MGLAHPHNQRHRIESAPTRESRTTRGTVVHYSDSDADPSMHESVTLSQVAAKLAALKGYDFAGEYDRAARYDAPLYFVPGGTLVGIDAAGELGIYSEDDLFGGVVPYPFVATKTITHPLVHADAFAPKGWSHDFGQRVQDDVLFGFAAFTVHDARRAGALVLERGPARLKPARGVGGRGQTVVSGLAQLNAVIAAIDAEQLSRSGIIVEQNLENVRTYSVGQVRVSDLLETYFGTQRLTTDNRGAKVYGGSDLVVVRGDYETLLELDLAPEVRLAVEQARSYDTAAFREFPGLFASRRNYDVAQGVNAEESRRSGVLEQSWRIGGASSAEIAALEAFRADPTLRAARASCAEAYGAIEAPPPNAVVYFRGTDDRVGPITKYTVVEAHGNPRSACGDHCR